jgi:hypothetical protein
MAFLSSAIDTQVFYNPKDMEDYLEYEAKNTVYIPLSKYIENEALFSDDRYFGYKKSQLTFNDEGFGAFCSNLSIPKIFISKIQEYDLVSSVLNDYLYYPNNVKYKVPELCLVIDKEKSEVIGVVSNKYVRYSNKRFVNDLKNKLSYIYHKYDFEEAYNHNTMLVLRYVSPEIKAGRIYGRGGEGEDISRIGYQLINSMVGNSSIKIEYYIKRLICANSLCLETAKKSGYVIHSGRQDTFAQRLDKKFIPLMQEITEIPKLVETLMSIEYNPETIVDSGAHELVYEIISPSQETIEERKKIKNKKRRREFDIKLIENYIRQYGGNRISARVFNSIYRDNQSMFDYINIFTEHAHRTKKLDFHRRREIERKSGNLAKWIYENKEKFTNIT